MPAKSVIHGTTALAEADEETFIHAPDMADAGLCQVRIDVTPEDAQLVVTVEAAGQIKITRRSHHGQRIELRYRVSYGVGSRSEANDEAASVK